jgi:regulator of protease activity HflC (stomatin/prohibitin superfamily)
MKVLVERPISVERPARTMSGSPILFLNVATVVAVPFILIDGFRMGEWASVVGGVLVWVAMGVVWRGFFTLEPNEACVLVGWGHYHGTVRDTGFHWTNPFVRKKPVSLRAQTLCVEKLKVHDKQGAPLEMAATVVWRVTETARATFDVSNVEDYVRHHCENAVRHIGCKLPELAEENSDAVRRGLTQLQQTLRHELQQRVSRAGVTIDEVRLTQRCVNWMSSNAGALSAA